MLQNIIFVGLVTPAGNVQHPIGQNIFLQIF